MIKIIWIVLALVLIGNSFFVLPFHFSDDSISNNHILNYKKDSFLLHTVFTDSVIPLQLNMPALYNALYYSNDPNAGAQHPSLIVNVSFLDNLDFFSLTFPFYKSVNCTGEISFYSVVKMGDHPDRDSTALIGNIKVLIRASIKGICSPLYVRTLVEKEFVEVLKKEMGKVEVDINRVSVDTVLITRPVDKIRVSKRSKENKK